MRKLHLTYRSYNSQEPLPDSVHKAPSLLSANERAFLYMVTRDHYKGTGRILDLGAFLGGSALILAQAVRDSGVKPAFSAKPVVAVDTFENSNQANLRGLEGQLSKDLPGKDVFKLESLLSVAEHYTAPMQETIDLVTADASTAFPVEGPIEIVLLDVWKNSRFNYRVLTQNLMRPGATSAIFFVTKYFLDRVSENKIVFESLASHLDYLGEGDGMAAFRSRGALPVDEKSASAFARLKMAARLDALDRAASRSTSGNRRFLTAMCKFHEVEEHLSRRAAADMLKDIEGAHHASLLNALRTPTPNYIVKSWRAAADQLKTEKVQEPT